MWYMIFILALIVIIVFGFIYFINQTRDNGSSKEKNTEDIGSFFLLKKYFFTHSEKLFFDELRCQNNDEFVILSKVRLEDIVFANKSLNWKEKGIKRNYIKSKHLDFVILDKHYGNILSVIELDGKSHHKEKQRKYDSIKNSILSSVGVNFHRVKLGENFEEKIQEIFSELKKK